MPYWEQPGGRAWFLRPTPFEHAPRQEASGLVPSIAYAKPIRELSRQHEKSERQEGSGERDVVLSATA